MSELSKTYEAGSVENQWYKFWEDGGYFKADAASPKPAYTIVIPPPNVTGVLHMGHALVNTLQDILIRWKRMQGFEALWVPGTDHAGIATQTVVERHLMKTQGKSRRDFSREDFLKHIWEWKEKSQDQILNQLRRLGCSCDWSRLRFTMDAGCNRGVRTMFKKMFDQGLIYKGDYLVNWDPVTLTALADDEVEYEERQSHLWYFKYPFKDGSGFAHIATTRPETMLGDTAIAVSPRDTRYAHLIGKTVVLPLMNREIPIIGDHHVDPEFGTGMVKVTPAHDPNDYEMGLTHKLEFINIMNPDATINENGGMFAGLTMEDARGAIVEAMREKGLLEKVEPHLNRVGVSYRSKAVIEPYMSKQWFVRMEAFGQKLRAAVEEGRFKLIPKNWENTYFHWINNLRDWCISRQLWWGHRIPVWYLREDPNTMICYDGEDMPPEVKANPEAWVQDEDVLDTWYSSALWPMSLFGWPEKTPDLAKFYPTSVLVTGHDILFFWVARMLVMGEYGTGQLPFPESFLHGLIYGKSYWRTVAGGGIAYCGDQERLDYDLGKPVPKDVHSKWEKMSKSKGNIIDPLEIIDQYGTDAMRMALCASATQARQIDLDRRRFEEFKNFTNKLWNGARFVFMNLTLTPEQFHEGLDEKLLSLEDHWILSKLNHTIQEVNEHLSGYHFDLAAGEAYDFFWKEFCSYYVEIVKPILFGKAGSDAERLNKQKLLAIVLLHAVRLIHPMAPFISEELFQQLKARLGAGVLTATVDPYTAEAVKALSAPACIVSPYPAVIRAKDLNPDIEESFALIEQIVYTIRNIRGEMKLPPGTATDVHIVGGEHVVKALKDNIGIISALVRTQQIALHHEEPSFGFSSTGIIDGIKVIIPLPQEMLKQEAVRLAKEQEKLTVSVERLRGQLGNAEFVANAPAQLVEKQRQQLAQAESDLASIAGKLAQL